MSSTNSKNVDVNSAMLSSFNDYSERLQQLLKTMHWQGVEQLCQAIWRCWQQGCRVYLCGNGGSAGNAVHIANDLLYGVNATPGKGINVEALTANIAVLTCLANDEGYEEIFSVQLKVKAKPGDILIVLSGSGNSKNVINALKTASSLGATTAAVLGYDGGRCKALADIVVHAEIDDMQISEDIQLVVGHMMMQWFRSATDALLE
ncbi:MAG: SIS domain-containing protein [Pseudomonadales bacterium]